MNINFKKLFSKEKETKGTKYERLNPYRDWSILLLVFIVINTVVLGFSGYFLFRIKQGDLFSGDEKEGKESVQFNKEDLEQTVRLYQARQDALGVNNLHDVEKSSEPRNASSSQNATSSFEDINNASSTRENTTSSSSTSSSDTSQRESSPKASARGFQVSP